MVLLNAGTKPREMNATLVDIFWNNGPAGTAAEIQQSWDVYDLWANRMSDDEAWVIINATSSPSGSTNRTGGYDLSAMGGFEKVYSETPSSSSKVLMGWHRPAIRHREGACTPAWCCDVALACKEPEG